MALLALTPTALTKATALNVTALLGSLGANTGVSFPNTGREFLVVSTSSATPSTPSTPISITIQGAAVGSVTAGALGTNGISVIGPWSSQFDKTDGTYDVEVDFSSATGVTVALLQLPGVS